MQSLNERDVDFCNHLIISWMAFHFRMTGYRSTYLSVGFYSLHRSYGMSEFGTWLCHSSLKPDVLISLWVFVCLCWWYSFGRAETAAVGFDHHSEPVCLPECWAYFGIRASFFSTLSSSVHPHNSCSTYLFINKKVTYRDTINRQYCLLYFSKVPQYILLSLAAKWFYSFCKLSLYLLKISELSLWLF